MLQELISNFTTTNIDFKTLAKSYFELANAKSADWMRRIDLVIEAVSCDGLSEIQEIMRNEYSDIMNTPLPLEDGSAVSLQEYVIAMANDYSDPELQILIDKTGTQHTVASITQYLSDQAVNLTAQTCAFQAIMDASVDPITGSANVQFSNYYTLVQSQLGELSQRGKSIINYYYNILSDSTIDMTTKLQLMLAPIQSSVTNYNEEDDDLNVEFFVPQDTYTGISSFSAWCISNDVSWDDAWSVIKGGFKAIGTVIASLWKGISSISGKIFGYALKPFNNETGVLRQRSKYTTNFVDIPVAQGKTSLTKLFYSKLSPVTQRDLNYLCQANEIPVDQAMQYINDKVNSQSITSIDFTSFRILLWQDNDDDDVISFIVNVSPIATGSIYSNPCVGISETGDSYIVRRGILESLNQFSTDIIGEDLDLNDASHTLSGLLASLNNMALVLGASLLTDSDLADPVCSLPSYTDMSTEQYTKFRELASFIGGFAIKQTTGGGQYSYGLGFPNKFVDFGTSGDWWKADGHQDQITNADIVRIICNGDFSVINDSNNTEYANRGRGIIASICWLFLRQHFNTDTQDDVIYIPYTHVYSIGTPRFVVQGDPTGASFAAWLSATTILALTVVVLGASTVVRQKRRRSLAKWQAEQWRSTVLMTVYPVGSEAYNSAQAQLVKVNRKIQRIDSLLEVTGDTPLASLASGINLTAASTDDIVNLIR